MMVGMTDRDPAFLWETEALRGATPRSSAPPRQREGPSPSDWVTLRQAGDATGLEVTTLRNWARKGRVPTTLDQTPEGPRRLVSLEGVRARARHLGQTANPVEAVASIAPKQEQEAVPGSPPPGTMLVPIDAWDKMLLQLGNLHQAGQQLAEARERAARAETEAGFLRERLAELRQAATAPDPIPEVEPPAVAEPSPTMEPESAERAAPSARARMPSLTAYLWRMAVSERRRKSR